MKNGQHWQGGDGTADSAIVSHVLVGKLNVSLMRRHLGKFAAACFKRETEDAPRAKAQSRSQNTGGIAEVC